MIFKEEDAIKVIKDLLNYNDINKVKQVLQNINPEVFKNEVVKERFKEILVQMYNNDNVNYLKNLLNNFIKDYKEFKGTYHFWFCSEQFRNKFKRKDFRNPIELKRFREIIERIIQSRKDYPTEDIGEFFISPRGHERHRLVWFIKDNAIYFCEAFHHDKEYEEFCERAKFRIIGRKNYFGWDYAETFEPLHLRAA